MEENEAPAKKRSENRIKRMMPLNLPLLLDDGRVCLIRKGHDKLMECRQKAPGPPLRVGDLVLTVPGKDGRKAALQVVKRGKKNVTLRILGSCDADAKIVDGEGERLGQKISGPVTQGEGFSLERRED